MADAPDLTLFHSTNLESRVKALETYVTGNVTYRKTPTRADIFDYAKRGSIVEVTFNNVAYGENIGTDTIVAIVPYKPSLFTRFTLIDQSKNISICYIDTYGQIVISGYTAFKLLYGSVCYVTND